MSLLTAISTSRPTWLSTGALPSTAELRSWRSTFAERRPRSSRLRRPSLAARPAWSSVPVATLATRARSGVAGTGRALTSIASDRSVGSIGSSRSRYSVLSRSSIGSAASAWSMLSVGSFLSFGSAGSVLSIGSVGSVLSIGSSGSVLSIGASGGFLTIGNGRHAAERYLPDDQVRPLRAVNS